MKKHSVAVKDFRIPRNGVIGTYPGCLNGNDVRRAEAEVRDYSSELAANPCCGHKSRSREPANRTRVAARSGLLFSCYAPPFQNFLVSRRISRMSRFRERRDQELFVAIGTGDHSNTIRTLFVQFAPLWNLGLKVLGCQQSLSVFCARAERNRTDSEREHSQDQSGSRKEFPQSPIRKQPSFHSQPVFLRPRRCFSSRHHGRIYP
ncbi:hypothetical protein RIdsm_05684 (plasmid) [Roseovarius indicus]|uniref:Uncharacterized protein n=1 Tax=Roseovarius indicus TaxID=540747 RepID=A0A5P3AN28_9RHOB|nr:hypothetical protein RIdsm_05684 [Roseovarius indicus]SFE86871.1 hypothetical protein SAMN04488031_13215 [Roseovarius indicus]